MLTQALRDRASDVHIEPMDTLTRVRFRIDGVLHDVLTLPGRHGWCRGQSPQGARRHEHRRAAARPGRPVHHRDRGPPARRASRQHGNRRRGEGGAAPARQVGGDLPALGARHAGRHLPGLLRRWFARRSAWSSAPGRRAAARRPASTPRWASSTAPSVNIMTIEDPVEYVVPSINQIQINEQAGISFASGLRSIMRQDPDVILVGEIRDDGDGTHRGPVRPHRALRDDIAARHRQRVGAAPIPRHGHRGLRRRSAVAGVAQPATAAPDLRPVPPPLRTVRPRSSSTSSRPAASCPTTGSRTARAACSARSRLPGPRRRVRAAPHDAGDACPGGDEP